jgi:hypothetical protein
VHPCNPSRSNTNFHSGKGLNKSNFFKLKRQRKKRCI